MERDTLPLPPKLHSHTIPWMEPQPQDVKDFTTDSNIDIAMGTPLPLTSFKSMLDSPDCYINSASAININSASNIAFVPNPTTTAIDNNFLIPHNMDPSFPPFSPPKPSLNPFFTNPFESSFDLGHESGFYLGNHSSNSPVLMGFSQTHMGTLELSSGAEFPPATRLLPATDDAGGGALEVQAFGGSDNNALFLNRGKVLRPLEVLPQMGVQPTLFQKRAALRRGGEELEGVERVWGKWDEGEVEGGSIDASGMNYDSDEVNENGKVVEENVDDGGGNLNPNGTVNGGKGKKKGMPAKNLMAERRRRKKLNDRLYMLRSVVPKISKMDRASILGDAIDYLKELLQRINDLHNELESTPPGSLLPPSTSFQPLTPTPATLPCRVKDELYPGALPSPKNQPTKVEVKVREGRAVNIHMFCTRRPGLLLSTMRALDNLGLDVQQAVISCFNGFALDVFRAEQCIEGQDVLPEQIKAVLLDSVGFHGMM